MPLNSFSYSYPYLIFFLFLFIFSLPIVSSDTKSFSLKVCEKWKVILVFFVFVWFVGLRAFVGWDLSVYYPFFNKYLPTIKDGKSGLLQFYSSRMGQNGWESGYIYFCILIKSVCNNYFFYRCLITIIFTLFFYELLKDNIPNNIVMGLLFLFIFEGYSSLLINLERFFIAMSIFFLGYKYIKSGEFKKYLFVIIIACFFHTQAILYIPIYFFVRKKHSRFLIIFMFFLGNAIYILNITFIKRIISLVLSFIPGRLGVLAGVYLNSEQFNSSRGIGLGFLERFVTYLLIIVLRKEIYSEEKNIIATNFLLLCLWCHLFLSEMSILETRVSLSFAIGYWLFYPILYEKLKKEWKMVFLVIFLFYAGLKVYVTYNAVAFYYENVCFDYTNFEVRNNLLNRYRLKSGTPVKIY